MRGYTRHLCPPPVYAHFERATDLVARIPDDLTGTWLRCHEVARAVGHVLDLPVQDGHYRTVQHSWLWADPNQRWILDVYSVARLPPVQIVDTAVALTVDRRPSGTELTRRVHIYSTDPPGLLKPIDEDLVREIVSIISEEA